MSPSTPPDSTWAAPYPNPPDLCFDYRKLLEQPGGIATASGRPARICIVGAGVTGLTAARELLRCGFGEITLIKQSRRVGGRHLTLTARSSANTLPSTPFEMGAMRMPLFNKSGQPPKEGRSLMAYYASLFELRLSDFPNPGTPGPAATRALSRRRRGGRLQWRRLRDTGLPGIHLRARYDVPFNGGFSLADYPRYQHSR